MVFYLKYRPQKIKELDSSLLREKLDSVLKGRLPNKIPHAFLFTGPKGLGKTSAARIIAKAINCTNRKAGEIEPCNKCTSCVSITNGTNLDILEIDAASNRGIDEIRDLREKIRLSPVSSLKKIYIIDEVHMLTTEAFNALLKTLEEPPEHAVFILCTTEPQKIPETILSRCFHIQFPRATEEDLVSSFQRIIKGEGLSSDKEALLEITKLSDGSFRDGAKILEEISTHSKKITKELLEKKFKTKNLNHQVESFIKYLEEKDAKSAIQLLSELEEEGLDFKFFSEQLISKFHALLVAKVHGKDESNLTLSDLRKVSGLFTDAYTNIKYSPLPQLPLELAVVEWADQESDVPAVKEEVEEKKEEKIQTVSNGSGHDKILEDLIDKVKKENFSIAGVLRGCRIESFDGKSLKIATTYKFHKERLDDQKTFNLLEKLSSEILGEKVKVSIILK